MTVRHRSQNRSRSPGPGCVSGESSMHDDPRGRLREEIPLVCWRSGSEGGMTVRWGRGVTALCHKRGWGRGSRCGEQRAGSAGRPVTQPQGALAEPVAQHGGIAEEPAPRSCTPRGPRRRPPSPAHAGACKPHTVLTDVSEQYVESRRCWLNRADCRPSQPRPALHLEHIPTQLRPK